MARRLPILVATLLVATMPLGLWGRGADDLVEANGAFIREADGAWVIGNPQLEFEIGGKATQAGIRGIRDPLSGRDFHRSDGPDAFVVVNGQRHLPRRSERDQSLHRPDRGGSGAVLPHALNRFLLD